MKYLKSFEGNIIRKYWRVRITEPYFEISMKKIGASDLYESMITNENFLDYKNNQKNKNKVYIIYSTNNNSCKFKWIYFDKYIKDNYDYQGEVDVTKQDIEQLKLEKDTNKFNL